MEETETPLHDFEILNLNLDDNVQSNNMNIAN